MDEKEIISQIRKLKAVQPSDEDMKIVKQKILLRTNKQVSPRQKFWYRWIASQRTYTFIGVSAIAVLVLFFSLLSKSQWIQTEVYSVRIQLSQSSYERAKLSLDLMHLQLQYFTTHTPTEENANRLIASIDMTASNFSQLHLQGVSGQYTKEQCQNLFLSFAQSIDGAEQHVKTTVASSPIRNKTEILRLFHQHIDVVEKSIDSRLKFYKKRV